ncbi:GP179 protein, partial [Psilopogon haemacephalus]|nr:GP179 protein [Psilopogon haemacephalus]
CRPCRQGCASCEDDAPCLIQEDWALRAAVLSCQACCMLAVFLSMLISYHYRRSKARTPLLPPLPPLPRGSGGRLPQPGMIRTSGVVLLETILFGSLLLYFPVFILYFKPSIFRCIVLRWVRLLGFAIVYGTITLKLYSASSAAAAELDAPRGRQAGGSSAQPAPQHPLGPPGICPVGGLGAACSAGLPLLSPAAEMLFLLWGSFLCYATRAVPSAFHEPRYMGIALHNELIISATFHVLRFIMVPSLHPDWTLLLFFAHTHGTITMTLALLFIPKVKLGPRTLREEIAAEVYEDELDVGRSGSCLTSSLASAWSEHSLDPDDIREELKKLYLQLEVHKARKVTSNNPHLLPRRRSSSRRSLCRSLARR